MEKTGCSLSAFVAAVFLLCPLMAVGEGGDEKTRDEISNAAQETADKTEAPIVKALLEKLKNQQDEKVKGSILDALAESAARSPQATRPALPMLNEIVKNQENLLWVSAVHVITAMRAEAKDSVPALLASVGTRKGGDPVVNSRTLGDALAAIGTSTIPAVLALAKSDDRRMRDAVAVMLGQYGPAGVQELAGVFRDKSQDARVRSAAVCGIAEAVAQNHTAAKRVEVASLLEALNDPASDMAKCAGEVLSKGER